VKRLGVRADGLFKIYHLEGAGGGEKRALDGVSFIVHEGERVGIIGVNGAGKTTLLQILAGISTPTSGRIDVEGRVTSVFTLGTALREELTGRENIYTDGELQGRTRAETAALESAIIEFAELGDFIDRPMRTYSTGMKSRLAFSLMVHVNPEILIVDEALSVGDAHFAAKATAKMHELAARGRILMLVSHSMSAIRSMCSRCIWMSEGRIRMDGDPAGVTDAYLDAIRRSDDEQLLRSFRREVSSQSLMPGWGVGELRFLRTGRPEELSVMQTGEPTAVELQVQGTPASRFHASLRIRRLDGLFVCESQSAGIGDGFVTDSSGRARVVADLGALPLNAGIYSLGVSVSTAAAVAARRSRVFEVVNPSPHPGGKAVLVVPIQTESRSVSA